MGMNGFDLTDTSTGLVGVSPGNEWIVTTPQRCKEVLTDLFDSTGIMSIISEPEHPWWVKPVVVTPGGRQPTHISSYLPVSSEVLRLDDYYRFVKEGSLSLETVRDGFKCQLLGIAASLFSDGRLINAMKFYGVSDEQRKNAVDIIMENTGKILLCYGNI